MFAKFGNDKIRDLPAGVFSRWMLLRDGQSAEENNEYQQDEHHAVIADESIVKQPNCPAFAHGLCHRQGHDLLLRCPGDIANFAGNEAFVHHENAVAHAEHFGQLRANHENGLALPSQVVDQQINLILGADVDASRRLVENHDLRVGSSHFASTTFCWLPPDKFLAI